MKIEMHGISLPSPHEGEAFSQHSLIVPQSRQAFERFVSTFSDPITWHVVRFVDFNNEEPFIVSTFGAASAEKLRTMINFVIEVIDDQEKTRYFGSIISLEELTPETVRVIWELEPFLSFRFYPSVSDERLRISLSRAFVDRLQKDSSLISDYGLPDQPYAPRRMDVAKVQRFSAGRDVVFVVWVLTQIKRGGSADYEAGPVYCAAVIPNGSPLRSGFFDQWTEFKAGDISGAWISPLGWDRFPEHGFFQSSEGSKGNHFLYSFGIDYIAQYTAMSYDVETDFPLVPDEMHRMVFTDVNGSFLYELPKHRVRPGTIQMRLMMSASTCQVEVQLTQPHPDDPYPQVRARAANYAFNYACPAVDVILDQWAEYNARSREFEVGMRRVQNDQRRAEGLAGIGNAALGGAVSGAITGNPLGVIAGGAAGAAVSGIGALATHAIAERYGGKIQDLTDASYKLAQDTLVIAGNAAFYSYREAGVFLVALEGDEGSEHLMDTDINGNGYHVSLFEPDGERLLSVGGPMRAQVMIAGEAPVAVKNRISERIAQGVEVLRYV